MEFWAGFWTGVATGTLFGIAMPELLAAAGAFIMRLHGS